MSEWVRVDKDKLPDCEVLAINQKPHTCGYDEWCIGYLDYDENKDFVVCNSEYEILENVTSFMRKPEPPKE